MDEIKKLIIKQYKNFVIRLNKGYKEDYTHIINKINYLDVCGFLDKKSFIHQRLLNEL